MLLKQRRMPVMDEEDRTIAVNLITNMLSIARTTEEEDLNIVTSALCAIAVEYRMSKDTLLTAVGGIYDLVRAETEAGEGWDDDPSWGVADDKEADDGEEA